MGYNKLIKLLLVLILATSALVADEFDKKVDELLNKMTLEEKVGQMTQITLQVVAAKEGTVHQNFELNKMKLKKAIHEKHVGSMLNVYNVAMSVDEWRRLIKDIQDEALKTRLKIPVLYGIDAIHGANYIKEGTLFPHNIAMAATRNPDLVQKSAHITAMETSLTGVSWNFNPVLGVGRMPLWSRLFETFGEDTYLVSVMGQAYIKGTEGDQNDLQNSGHVAACMKHYLGYSFPLSGKDRTPAWIPDRMLREIFLPPFKKAVEAGVHTVMVNSAEINGVPVHSSKKLLTNILKKELGFEGFVVSDWQDIINLYARDKVASSPEDAVRMAVNAGVDMSMVPYDYSFYDILLKLVREGKVSMTRIDDAVRRILKVKFKLGLFQNAFRGMNNSFPVGSPESYRVSLEAAWEAITLLKNDHHLLPLSKDIKVLVTGPSANLRSVMNGGWSYTWQGNLEELYPETHITPLLGIQEKIGKEKVMYEPGVTFDSVLNLHKVTNAAKNADVVIACIGEPTYCETPGNIDDLRLSSAQNKLIEAIRETGKPYVLVLLEGRPRIISEPAKHASGVLMAYLPGPMGGKAIADILFGDVNPSGKLPITYPSNVNDLTCYDVKPIEMDTENKRSPLWEFGYGLSYTTFKYSQIKLSQSTGEAKDSIIVSVTVQNTGKRDGAETVELYLRDEFRTVSSPVRQLKRFKKIYLKAGEQKNVQFMLHRDDFAFYDRSNQLVVEPGRFFIMIANQKAEYTITE